MPTLAHRKEDSTIADVPLAEVAVGDAVLVFPHEVCPVDGTVVEGHGVMDESYLTGEPYMISKTPGSTVLSGAINGESALTIRADKLAVDSRYAKIMQVMQSSQQQQPRIRRLGDQLGAYYTPVAVAIGIAAWLATGEAVRFLAVMVVATPCQLLIAIPVALFVGKIFGEDFGAFWPLSLRVCAAIALHELGVVGILILLQQPFLTVIFGVPVLVMSVMWMVGMDFFQGFVFAMICGVIKFVITMLFVGAMFNIAMSGLGL